MSQRDSTVDAHHRKQNGLQVKIDLLSFVCVCRRGRVERLVGTDTVPASSTQVTIDHATHTHLSVHSYLSPAADGSKKLSVLVYRYLNASPARCSSSSTAHRSTPSPQPTTTSSVAHRLRAWLDSIRRVPRRSPPVRALLQMQYPSSTAARRRNHSPKHATTPTLALESPSHGWRRTGTRPAMTRNSRTTLTCARRRGAPVPVRGQKSRSPGAPVSKAHDQESEGESRRASVLRQFTWRWSDSELKCVLVSSSTGRRRPAGHEIDAAGAS